jgi:molecular chaperone DnaK (HSP70)
MPYQIKEGANQLPIVVTRGGEFAIPEISAIVLDYAKTIATTQLQQPVSRAVVTVPASFNDAQRSATATAGAIAGLTVVRVLNEPTAAALAYGHTRNLKEIIAVYDFGGGTFDITILKLNDQVYEVLGTAGDTFLGGDDLDERLVDRMVEKFLAENRIDLRDNEVSMMRLRAVAEQTKIELSRRSRAVVRVDEIAYGAKGKALDLQIEITRDEFVRQVADIIDRTFPVCRESLTLAQLDISHISDAILVGGTTKIPYVRDQVAKFFGKPPRTDVNPEDAVAVGAALQATSLDRMLKRRTSSISQSMPIMADPTFSGESPSRDQTFSGEVPTFSGEAGSFSNEAPTHDRNFRGEAPTFSGEAASQDQTFVTMAKDNVGVLSVADEEPEQLVLQQPVDQVLADLGDDQATSDGGRGRGAKRKTSSYAVRPTAGTERPVTRGESIDRFDGDRASITPPPSAQPLGRLKGAPNPAGIKTSPGAGSSTREPVPEAIAIGPPPQPAGVPPPRPGAPPLPRTTRPGPAAPQGPPAIEMPRSAVPVAPPQARTMMVEPPPASPTDRGMPASTPPLNVTARGVPPAPAPIVPTYAPPVAPPVAAYVPSAAANQRTALELVPADTARDLAPASTAKGFVPPQSYPVTAQGAPISNPVVLDVTPRSLGIGTVAGFCEELIRRNSRVPTEIRKMFTTSRDQQDVVHIIVCQGEARRLDQNVVIGDLRLDGLPRRPRGETSIEVTFALDASGILQVRARDSQTGQEQRVSLDILGSMASGDVAASRDRLQALRR